MAARQSLAAQVGALLRDANASLRDWRLGDARNSLDHAAELYRRRGKRFEEARYLLLAATISRLAGDVAGAAARSKRATELATGHALLRLAASAERAETALSMGDGIAAAGAFGEAIKVAEASGGGPNLRAGLLERRAMAFRLAGKQAEAAGDLAAVAELWDAAGNREASLQARLLEASSLVKAGENVAAISKLEGVEAAAIASGNEAVLADLALLRAVLALEAGKIEVARSAAKEARRRALVAVAPVTYVAAAVALSELAERAGDDVGAYESVAVGWATLGDLLGRDAATAIFEPKLHAIRDAWGLERFTSAKTAYEESRRNQGRALNDGSAVDAPGAG